MRDKTNNQEFQTNLEKALSKVELFSGKNVDLHLHDRGGVISEAQDAGRTKLREELLTPNNKHLVFSFVPWTKKILTLPLMSKQAIDAGMVGMIINSKKVGRRGKADVLEQLCAILATKGDAIRSVTYYDDYIEILKESAERI